MAGSRINFSSFKKNLEEAGSRAGGKGNPFLRKLKSGKTVKVTGRKRRAVKKKLLAIEAKKVARRDRNKSPLSPPGSVSSRSTALLLGDNEAINALRKTNPTGYGKFRPPKVEKDPESGQQVIREALYSVDKFSDNYPKELPITYESSSAGGTSGKARYFNGASARRRLLDQESTPRRERIRGLTKSLQRKFGSPGRRGL